MAAAGYLTLNPFRYAHPVLSVALPLLFIAQGGIGLPGGAVYLRHQAFRSRWQQSLAVAIGPLVNVLLAIVLLHDQLLPTTVIGGILIVISVYLISRTT